MKRALAAAAEDDVEIEEGFIWEAMQTAYDPRINMIRDMRVDDSSLPFAANYYDYCANVIGESLKMPFSRQLWLALMLLGEVCPRCTKKKAFDMFNVPVDLDPHDLAGAMTLFEHGICPKCGATKWDCIQNREMKAYDEAVFVLGQRAGKSTTTAMITTYVFHRLLKSPRLSTIAKGIQQSTQLTASFVALTTTNSYKLLWMPVRDTIVDSDWFKSYFELMDEYGRRQGKELYQFNPTGTYFRSFLKGIDAFPAGPSMRALRGATRIIAATDELGHFPFNPNFANDDEEGEQRERANADEVHQVLSTSLATVRAEVLHQYSKGIFTYPTALNISISSPLSWQDKVMRLLKDAETSDTMLGVRAPTWEISPIFTRDHPVIVGAYNRNARRAERDFGANPPKLESAVFSQSVRAIFTRDNYVASIYDNTEEFTRARYVSKYEPAELPPSLMSLDAGHVNNSFTCTLMHPMTEHDGDALAVGKINVYGIIEVMPVPGTEIDFVYIYKNLLLPMAKAWNVREVYADRWNSVFLLRSFEVDTNDDIKAFQHTTTRRDSEAFIALTNAKQLILPKPEMDFDQIEAVTNFKQELRGYPVAHLYRQFRTTIEYQGILNKGSNSTDDILRAALVGATRFGDPKVLERFKQYPRRGRVAKSEQAAVLVGGRTILPQQMQAISSVGLVGRRRF